MDDILFQTRTKATNRVGDQIRHSVHWLTARRTKMILSRARLTCGDWNLPYAEFERALLVTLQTGLGPALILIVYHGDRVYQFAIPSEHSWRMETHSFWSGTLPFPVTRETRTLGNNPMLPLVTGIGLVASAIGLLLPFLTR